MISLRLLLVLFLTHWLTSHAIRSFTAPQGLPINDLAFTLADSIYIDVDQPIQAIRVGFMAGHSWPQDLEVHLLPPWSEWRGPINGTYNATASDLLSFSPLSSAITLLRHVNLAGSNTIQYFGNVTANEMFWLTSPVDPIWSTEVTEFKGSKQSAASGVFLPSDGVYPSLGFYQQNKMRRLIGRSPLGTWRLLFADSEYLDDGVLFSWSIELAYCGDGVLLPLVEQCDGTPYCDETCHCPAGCISTYEGTCTCPGPIIATTENIGLSEFQLDDIYRTMPTDDGDSHVTFFFNTTTNELTAQIIDSDDDKDSMTRVIAINSTFLDATATTEGFAMLRINTLDGNTEIVYTSVGIENEDSATFTVGTFNSSVTEISGMILPNGVDDNFAICVSHMMGQYTTDCTLTDPEGVDRITTSWTTDFSSTSPPALLLSNEVLLQVYVKDEVLWRRTVLVSDSVVHAPVQLFNLSSNSSTVQLTLSRNTNGEATVSVVQANGDISILKIKLSGVNLLNVTRENVAGANHLIVTNLDDNTTLAVYTSGNGSELSTRLLGSTDATQSIATGLNIQPDSALPLSRKRFLVTWAESSQKRQVPGTANLVYSTFTTCGNGIAEPSKDCDGGPHCNKFCTCENGFYPTSPVSTGCVSQCGDGLPVPDEQCDGGQYCNNCTCFNGYSPYSPALLASCAPTCGDGFVVPGELCDYLNDTSCDTNCKCKYGTIAVDGRCVPSSCGDLYLDLNFEVCDGGSGCGTNCFCGDNYLPTVPPSVACVPVQPTYTPGWSYYPPSGEEDGGFFETFGFISIILFVLFMVMLAGCVAGTIALTVIVLRRRQARRRQQFFNQNIEMEPKTSMPAPVEPESGAEPVPQTPTSPKKKDVDKDLNFGDMTDR